MSPCFLQILDNIPTRLQQGPQLKLVPVEREVPVSPNAASPKPVRKLIHYHRGQEGLTDPAGTDERQAVTFPVVALDVVLHHLDRQFLTGVSWYEILQPFPLKLPEYC